MHLCYHSLNLREFLIIQYRNKDICNLNFIAIILFKSFVEIMSTSCSQLELTLLLLDTIIAINDLRKCNPIYSIDTVMYVDDTKIFCKKRLSYSIGTGQYNGSSYRSHNELVLDQQATQYLKLILIRIPSINR